MSQSRIAEEMQQILLRRIATDKLALPSMPATASRCLALTRSNDVSLKQITATIEKDPMLVVATLRAANAAADGGNIKSVDQAVTRLGLEKIQTVFVEAGARKIFESRDERINEACAGMWAHSLAVALLARDLGALGGADDPEAAYLAGLLHDVGKPVLAGYLLEAERALARGSAGAWLDSEDWIDTVQAAHRPIGVALAEKWALPEAIIECIREQGDYSAGDRNSVANYVRFANAITKREGIYVGKVDDQDNDAMIMIGRSLLGIGDDLVVQLTSGLRDKIREQL